MLDADEIGAFGALLIGVAAVIWAVRRRPSPTTSADAARLGSAENLAQLHPDAESAGNPIQKAIALAGSVDELLQGFTGRRVQEERIGCKGQWKGSPHFFELEADPLFHGRPIDRVDDRDVFAGRQVSRRASERREHRRDHPDFPRGHLRHRALDCGDRRRRFLGDPAADKRRFEDALDVLVRQAAEGFAVVVSVQFGHCPF